MGDEQLAAIIARTDAAMALLMNVLIDKGLIRESEMSARLDRVTDLVSVGADGALVATVFVGMKAMLDRKYATNVGHHKASEVQ